MRHAHMHPLLQWVTGLSMNFFVHIVFAIVFLLIQILSLYLLYKKWLCLISVHSIFIELIF